MSFSVLTSWSRRSHGSCRSHGSGGMKCCSDPPFTRTGVRMTRVSQTPSNYGGIKFPSQFIRNGGIVWIVYINTHIYTYVRIYGHIYTYGSGSYCCLCIWQRDCSNLSSNVGVSSSNTPLYWLVVWNQSYGNVPMDCGIIFMFSVNSWIWLAFYQSDYSLFEKTTIFVCIVDLSRSIVMSLEKALICLRKAFIFLEKGVYFLRFPLWT